MRKPGARGDRYAVHRIPARHHQESPIPEIWDLPVWSPLYLLRSTHPCSRCGHAAAVVALAAKRYDDCLEDSAEAESSLSPRGWLHSALLTPVIRLPPELAKVVRVAAPAYAPAGTSNGVNEFTNHCRCGNAILDADVRAKPSARKYAVAVARVLVYLTEAERQLEALRQGLDPFAEDEYPDPGPEDRLSLEKWADMQVWDLSS